MATDGLKPMIKIGSAYPPQFINENGEWELVKGSDGAYRMQSLIEVSEEPFSASGNLTKEFSEPMRGIVISNDGNADLTFTIHGKTRTVKAGEVYEGRFRPFSTITITSSVPWRAEALQVYGMGTDYTPPVDTTAPDDVTGLNTSNITASSLTLKWNASDSSDCIGYDIYRGQTLIGSVVGTTFNVTGLSQATQYTFTVKAKDAANNISSGISTTVTTKIGSDTSPPEDVTNLTSSNITQTGVTLNWMASISSEVASYDVYNGTTFLANVTGTTYTINGLTAGTYYTFIVKAKDTSGNTASGTSVNITTAQAPVDNTAPTVTASPVGGVFNAAQTVTLTADEPSTIYYTLDGSTPTTASAVYLSPIPINMTTTLKYFGRDVSGNMSAVKTEMYTITILDTTPPIVTASPPGGTYPTAQTVTLTANEQAAIYYTTDGSTPSMGSPVYSGPISVDASMTIKFIGKDLAGNVSSVQSVVYTIGTVPGYVNDASLILYQDSPAINQTISNKDKYFHANEQFTAFATVKPVKGASNPQTYIFSRVLPNAVKFEFTYDNKFTTTLTGKVGSNGSYPQVNDATQRTDLSVFYHVVLVRDSTKLYFYVDNVLVNQTNCPSDFIIDDSSSPLLFGSTNNAPVFKNMGYYNRALTAAELTQNYNALK